MKRLHELLANISRKVLDRIGAECQYQTDTGIKTISAYLDENVLTVGDFGQYTGSQIQIEFLKADVDPKRGDTCTIDGVEYVIEGKIFADQTNNSTVKVSAYKK